MNRISSDAQPKPLTINFAPTGMVPTRGRAPHAPLRVEEIIREVRAAFERGITVAHLHARGEDETPSSDPQCYAEIIAGIRATCPELVLCVSLSGRVIADSAVRATPLNLTGLAKPDMGSLTLSSMNFARQTSQNAPDTIRYLCERMLGSGVMPELEVFDAGMINYGHYLITKGLLRPPFYFNILLGNVATAQCDLLHAGMLVRDLPPESLWAFGGFGRHQLPANAFAIASGGGVRVGLEDNLYFDSEGQVPATNLQLLERVHQLAKIFDRPIMKAAEFRAQMKLRTPAEGYGREPVFSPGEAETR